MKVWDICEKGLIQREVPKPKAKKGYKLVKVSSIGINRADLLQIHGHYPSPDGSTIPGLEISGTIEESNEQVCAILQSGGYSEFALVPDEHLMPIPPGYNLIEAAAFPEAVLTAYLNIFKYGNLQPENNILIHGATSGIGSYAIQLCKAYGSKVFASVGSIEKIHKVRELNADLVFNYNSEWVTSINDSGGADVILDILGEKTLEKNLKVLNKYGTLVIIAVMSGVSGNINLASILMKNLRIIGSTLRSQSNHQKSKLIKEVIKELYPLITKHEIRPVIDSIFGFDDLPKALERLDIREHYGKIVVKVS